MISAAELKVLVGVYGIPEANRKLVKFDTDLKALASSDPTVTLHADVDRAGFEEFAALKAIAQEGVTAEVHADTTGFEKVWGQIDAIRAATSKPIVQEVELRIDKSSLASLGAAEAAVGASSGGSNGGDAGFLGALAGAHGGGGGKGLLPTVLWGGHSPGGRGRWWSRLLLGGGLLAGAGSLGAFAGLGAEHALFTVGGVAGSAGSAALGAGLIGAGALGTMAAGGGSDLAVMKTTLSQTKELGTATEKVQQAMALYGAHSKEAARAVANLRLAEQELGGGKGVHAEAKLAERADALGEFWKKATQDARVQAAHIMDQVVGLGHRYVPLVAHAADQNLSIIDADLKPLFRWLEGPEGVGVFEQLEAEFRHNLPDAMHAFDQGVQFVLKTIGVASKYTGGFTEKLDAFFTKWNEPGNFAIWEGTIGNLVGDFHLWVNLIKEAGRDVYDLFSNDAHTGNAIVETLTHMLHRLGEWERSTAGSEDLHNLFTVHREEIVALLHVIPPLISAISPIYMTVAPELTMAMTGVLGVVANFLKLLDETGPITRWGLGLTAIATKLFGFKAIFGPLGRVMWGPFKSLLAKDPLIARFFQSQVAETDGLTTATEGLTTAVGDLATAYEGLATTAAGAATEQRMLYTADSFGVTGAIPVGGAAASEASTAAGTTVAEDAAIAGGAGGVAGLSTAGATVGEDAAGTGSKLSGFASDAAGSIFAKAGAVAAGYFITEFGTKLVAPGALEGQNLEQALFHGFNTKGVAQTEARALGDSFLRELHHSLAQGGTPGELMYASHNRARTISPEQTEAIRSEAGALKALQSELVTRLGDIRHLVQEGSLAAATAFGKYSPQWRAASADNMHAAVEAIEAGERQGLISTEQGQQEIAHYLRDYHLLAGSDPLHIASAFTQSWREAGHVSESGIANALAELRKMPPVAEALALKTMEGQVRQYERGGQLAKGTFSRLRSAIVTELQATRTHGGAQVEHFVSEFGGAFGGLSIGVEEALANIGFNVSEMLSKLGAHNIPHFELKALGATHLPKGHVNVAALPELGHQRGGHINIGDPSGDSVPAMLERGEYVLNRNAVAEVGVHRLNAINFGAAPRFQEGGHLGPEPRLTGGTGPLEQIGQDAIHAVYKGAQHYLAQHQPHGGASLAGLNVPTGPIEQMAKEMVLRAWGPSQWAPFVAIEMSEAGWNPQAVNPSSGAAGLAQALPASKYPAGAWPYRGPQSAKLQLQWMIAYIRERYGSPAAAWAFHQANNYYAEGGLIGAAEKEVGVPNSKAASEAASKRTPTNAVRWEMSKIGQSEPWNSENPGEWCGDFQAAAMRAIGLHPPGGYASAAAWANYGSDLGKANMQPGAIIDYGGQHVAMAVNSSKMVSGNWAGVVATSPIEAAVKGTPITAVRWPPYSHGPGAGSAPSETVPAQFAGAQTATLSLSAPKSLQGVEREIAKWSQKLHVYEHAAELASGRPKLQAAIHKNVMRIQRYLRELDRARHKLRVEKAKRRYSGHLTRALGRITGMETEIQAAQRAYEGTAQYAEQVVSLEPTEPILPPGASEQQQKEAQEAYAAAFQRHVGQEERPAYGRLLGDEAAWRNTILHAESKATGIEGGWEYQIRGKVAEEKAIERYAANVEKHLREYRAKHPTSKLPEWLAIQLGNRKDLLEKLPTLRFQERELRKSLGEGRAAFYGGTHPYGPVHPPTPPLPGTGSFEEALIGVQGIHWPGQHELLAALPPYREAGHFGGAIWQTQEAIEGLGLKIQQAAASLGAGGPEGRTNTEREHLLEELLLQANQRELLNELERQTLHGAHLMPYAGAYAAGGAVAALVGEQGPEIVATHPGSYIHTAAESRSMLAPKVVVNIYEGEGIAEVEIDDQKVEAVVNRMDRRGARTARRGLARAGV